jgi:hypothetical protein
LKCMVLPHRIELWTSPLPRAFKWRNINGLLAKGPNRTDSARVT